MSARSAAAALALLLAALACGRYGPPERTPRGQASAETAPVTDPAVPAAAPRSAPAAPPGP